MKKGVGAVPKLVTFLQRAAGNPLNKLAGGFRVVGLDITDLYFDGNKQAGWQLDRFSVSFLSLIQDNESTCAFLYYS